MSKGLVFGGLNGSGGNNIKSVQRGRVSFTGTSLNITISNIIKANSIVIIDSFILSGIDGFDMVTVSAKIVDNTTINLNRNSANANTIVSYTVIEFTNVKGIQSGEINYTATVQDVTISSVNLEKSFLVYSMKLTTYQTTNTLIGQLGYILDTTTIRFENVTSPRTLSWFVVEFN